MTDITIPTVALEAAARAMWRTDEPSQWELGMADIALRAGVNAWPGRSQLAENDSASIREMACFILPLPKEKTND
ncbi:MAG: hypothetical protein K9G27_08985 [Sphingomonadaceae bacterium]|nr:hypothetical protein [Sphingomonadaceae bacterium]